MPDDDFKVSPLSNLEVRSVAKKLRAFFGVENDERVDVLKCARSDKILTVKGVRPFRYEIISDHRMDGDHGKTNYDGDTIVVAVSRSTHHNAFMGMGHARNTIAHELGHATLHFEKLIHGAVMARRIGANVTPGWIKSYESAEHQTKVFAPAFLVNDEVARTLDSPDEISVRFGISQQSAEIYHAQILEERETSIKRTELDHREIRGPHEVVAYLIPDCAPLIRATGSLDELGQHSTPTNRNSTPDRSASASSMGRSCRH